MNTFQLAYRPRIVNTVQSPAQKSSTVVEMQANAPRKHDSIPGAPGIDPPGGYKRPSKAARTYASYKVSSPRTISHLGD